MPRWNQTAVFNVSARGVTRSMRQLSNAEDAIQEEIEETLDELRKPIRAIFRENSVSRRVGDELVLLPFGAAGTVGFQLVSTYRDPLTGYDPLGVTRFGHRKKYIQPSEDRARASTVATRLPRGPEVFFNRRTGRFGAQQQALRMHGEPRFRHKVKGQSRREDWVDVANQEARPLIAEATARLGRRIVSRAL